MSPSEQLHVPHTNEKGQIQLQCFLSRVKPVLEAGKAARARQGQLINLLKCTFLQEIITPAARRQGFLDWVWPY